MFIFIFQLRTYRILLMIFSHPCFYRIFWIMCVITKMIKIFLNSLVHWKISRNLYIHHNFYLIFSSYISKTLIMMGNFLIIILFFIIFFGHYFHRRLKNYFRKIFQYINQITSIWIWIHSKEVERQLSYPFHCNNFH